MAPTTRVAREDGDDDDEFEFEFDVDGGEWSCDW